MHVTYKLRVKAAKKPPPPQTAARRLELMAACPKCAHENDDVDFCVNCGTYLRWDPTRIQPAVTLPEPDAPAAPAEPRCADTRGPRPAGAASSAAPAAASPRRPRPRTGRPPDRRRGSTPSRSPCRSMRTMDMPVIRTGEPHPAGHPGRAPSLLTPEAVQITLTYPELPGNVQKLVVEAGGHGSLPGAHPQPERDRRQLRDPDQGDAGRVVERRLRRPCTSSRSARRAAPTSRRCRPLQPAAERRGRGEGLGARGGRGLARAGRGRGRRRGPRSRSRRTSSSRASCAPRSSPAGAAASTR